MKHQSTEFIEDSLKNQLARIVKTSQGRGMSENNQVQFDPLAVSDSIRRPLNAFQRYNLEKQFNEQVPEYSKVGERKHSVMMTAYGAGAAAGLVSGAYVTKRYLTVVLLNCGADDLHFNYTTTTVHSDLLEEL